MAEILENTMLGSEEVVVGDYPGIELVEEYSDQVAPEYIWEMSGNLIACLRFPDESMLKKQFQKFIIERQDQARRTEKMTAQSEKDIEAWEEESRAEEKIRKEQEKSLSEMQFEMTEPEDNEPAPPDENNETEDEDLKNEPPTINYKKAIWARGAVLDYQIEDADGRIVDLPVEIRCDVEPNLIMIKVGNEEKLRDKRKVLSEILNSLGVSSEVERFAVCNCQLCQKAEEKALGTAYRIPYQRIENLKERYVPRIQCYGSGKRQRLDEISILDRPKIKVAIIHESQNDNDFCKNVKEWFSKQDIDARVWDKNDLLAGDEVEQKINQEIHESDVLIALISPHLFADEKTIDVMLEPSVKRAKKENALLLGLVVRETVSWQDCSPFNLLDSSIVTLSEEPISSLEANKIDKVWKTSGEKLHAEIDKWLDKTHRYKLKK